MGGRQAYTHDIHTYILPTEQSRAAFFVVVLVVPCMFCFVLRLTIHSVILWQAQAAARAWLSPGGWRSTREGSAEATTATARSWAARTTGRVPGRGILGRTLTTCWWCSRGTTAKPWTNEIICGRYTLQLAAVVVSVGNSTATTITTTMMQQRQIAWARRTTAADSGVSRLPLGQRSLWCPALQLFIPFFFLAPQMWTRK